MTCIAPGTRESWLNSQGCTAIGHAFVEVSVLSADAAPAIARTARRAGTLVAGPEAVCAMWSASRAAGYGRPIRAHSARCRSARWKQTRKLLVQI
jgi:hypothetical protein